MNLNRNIAPPIRPFGEIGIIHPEHRVMKNGIPLHVIQAGTEDVVRLDLLIGGGLWHQSQPLQAMFANRMLREGTLHLTSSEIAERLDFYGAWMELSTSMNCNFLTLYSLNKFFPQSLAILLAMMKEASFPEEEMKVTIESNRQQFIVNSTKVDVMTRKEFNKAIFSESHPCGRHAVLEDYDRLTTQDLKEFYRRYYHSENCSIYLSGYVTEAVLNQIRNEFGSAPWGEPSPCEPLTPLPTLTFKGRRIHVEHPTAVQSSVRLGCPLMDRNHPDFSGMKVLTTVLGGYFGSRLMSNIREEKGYTYGISATIASFPFQGYLAIGTETANEYVEPCIREVKNEMRRLQEERVSDQELTMVKNYMMGEMCRSYEGPFSLSEAWIFVETAGLEKNFFLTHAKKIRSVSAEDLRDLAIKYFRPDDMLEVVAGKKI